MTGGGSLREQTVRKAVTEWARRLVNLDGRNRMLYFRELRRGTLEITPQLPHVRGSAVEGLLAGGSVRLNELFKDRALDDAAAAAISLAAKARSNFEEKGLATLYIGHSFAKWTRSDGHEPRAPVAMIPIRIRVDSPGGHDALVELRGPAEPNPSLIHAMRQDLGTNPYPPADDRPEDFRDWLAEVEQACASVPGFEMDDRLFLANLEFSKLPMVVDMEQNAELFVDNDLVAAIAGDEIARTTLDRSLVIALDNPDSVKPLDEFLVCDADSSQNYVINAAVRGQSIVVHGPPGTGKSQTIANLISTLAAQHKSVLFVAEKRAAIGAVTRRLEAAGCGDLVLDLHDGTGRRQVARSLGESMKMVERLHGKEEVSPHEELSIARKKLVAHRDQMHRPRDPHGLSFFDLQAMLGTPDREATGVRLSADVLDRWTGEGRSEVADLLGRWHRMAIRLDDDPGGMWATSAIRSTDDAASVRSSIDGLIRQYIPAVEDAYRAALAELRLPVETELPIVQFSAFLTVVKGLLTRASINLIDNAPGLAEDLKPAALRGFARFKARLTDGAYRRARSLVRSLGLGADETAVLNDARRIARAQRQWSSWFPDRPLPKQAETAPALAAALDDYTVVRDRVIAIVPSLAAARGFREEDTALLALSERIDLADVRAELAETAAGISDYGLGPLLRTSTKDSRRSTDLGDLAMRVFAASAIDAITWQEPELAMFSGKNHQKVAQDFARLDRRHMQVTASRVMRRVAERASDVIAERPRETALLEHQVGLRSHLMPIRRLLASAPNVVQALRPCWAMSPLLVSRILPAAHELFDVVIFDEGSQILPIHAIPSIARAKQVVVAGDPRQLPPSEFFASESLEDEAEREELENDATAAPDAESILDVMRMLLPERNLLWHYRSQDERLINFSNAHIYGRSLVSFPGTNQGTGVSQILVDHLPATIEQTSSNPGVVAKAVELILQHAGKHPDESLGVIAMGVRHANDIREALRAARMDSEDSYGGFFEDKGAEPFFVKIMTTAQGDERDHIILSIGYGKTPDGEMVYRWGSLNRRGGERRLNVAVTRAKRRMTVVTSVRAADIDPERTKAQGAGLLREFLEYSEHGGDAMPGPDTAPLTPFEISVRDRLTAERIPVEPHYGGGRHRIDFAAFDRQFNGRPVLAIETDGVGYNSSDTARDRDRLRFEVLANRGWRHHRIWSIDWYRDPDGETQRVKAAWENASIESQDPALQHIGRTIEDRPVVEGRGRSPIPIRRSGILGYQREELVQLIKWIESDGVARDENALVAEAMHVLGFTDSKGRVGVALRGAIRQARG